jgi:hypothetical protein
VKGLDLKDFFADYREFTEFMAPKLASLRDDKKALRRAIIKAMIKIKDIENPIARRIVLRWYHLHHPYTTYLAKIKEYKKLRHYVMLARVQFQGRKVEEFKPLLLEEAKAVRVTEVLDRITERTGNKGFYACPLHNETSGSLKVYKNNSWYCFGCCRGGSVIDLVMNYYDIDLAGAIKYLIEG